MEVGQFKIIHEYIQLNNTHFLHVYIDMYVCVCVCGICQLFEIYNLL